MRDRKEINRLQQTLERDVELETLQWFEITKSIIDNAINRISEWDLPLKISIQLEENHLKAEEYRKFF